MRVFHGEGRREERPDGRTEGRDGHDNSALRERKKERRSEIEKMVVVVVVVVVETSTRKQKAFEGGKGGRKGERFDLISKTKKDCDKKTRATERASEREGKQQLCVFAGRQEPSRAEPSRADQSRTVVGYSVALSSLVRRRNPRARLRQGGRKEGRGAHCCRRCRRRLYLTCAKGANDGAITNGT